MTFGTHYLVASLPLPESVTAYIAFQTVKLARFARGSLCCWPFVCVSEQLCCTLIARRRQHNQPRTLRLGISQSKNMPVVRMPKPQRRMLSVKMLHPCSIGSGERAVKVRAGSQYEFSTKATRSHFGSHFTAPPHNPSPTLPAALCQGGSEQPQLAQSPRI